MVTAGASAQVTNLAISPDPLMGAVCPGTSVTVTFDLGSSSGGGTPYRYELRYDSLLTSTVFNSGAVTGSTFSFTPSSLQQDSDIFVTVYGNDNVATWYTVMGTKTPVHVSKNPAPATSFVVLLNNPAGANDTVKTGLVCPNTDFWVYAVGLEAGTTGVINWTSGVAGSTNPILVMGGINALTNFSVQVDDVLGCVGTTANYAADITPYTAPTAPTGATLDGAAIVNGSFCPGTYTFAALGGSGGDNPDNDTVFYENGSPITNNSFAFGFGAIR